MYGLSKRRSVLVRQRASHTRRRPLIWSSAPIHCTTSQIQWRRSRDSGGCWHRGDNWCSKISHGASLHSPGQYLSGSSGGLKGDMGVPIPWQRCGRSVRKRDFPSPVNRRLRSTGCGMGGRCALTSHLLRRLSHWRSTGFRRSVQRRGRANQTLSNPNKLPVIMRNSHVLSRQPNNWVVPSQAIERARSSPSCRRGVIRCEDASARIEAEQQPGTERGCPDNAVRVAGDFHQRNVRPWGREQTDAACCGVEATDVVVARLGEPDHSLLVNGHAVRNERLRALFTCQWILLHEPGVSIEPPQGARVQLRKPGVSVRIQRQVVGRARQRERLACMTGIGHRDRGQGVELIASRCGEVVSNIVGVLFGKPDRIVWRDLYTHNAVLSPWRRPLLERLRPWVKDGEVVPPHFAEPQASLVVNGEPHQAIV